MKPDATDIEDDTAIIRSLSSWSWLSMSNNGERKWLQHRSTDERLEVPVVRRGQVRCRSPPGMQRMQRHVVVVAAIVVVVIIIAAAVPGKLSSLSTLSVTRTTTTTNGNFLWVVNAFSPIATHSPFLGHSRPGLVLRQNSLHHHHREWLLTRLRADVGNAADGDHDPDTVSINPVHTTHQPKQETYCNNNHVEYSHANHHDDPSNSSVSSDGATTTTAAAATVATLEVLKQREAELAALLAAVRREKLQVLRARPLNIGIVGFGRFGQFIAKTFARHGKVVVTSRTDYSDIASEMGVTYIPMHDLVSFAQQDLDVIVLAVSILSFEETVQQLVPALQADLQHRQQTWRRSNPATMTAAAAAECQIQGPLLVDVLSVKEHARQVLLDLLPPECDILCTHPMFGPDSGKNGWTNLNFVYERTRINRVVLDPQQSSTSACVGYRLASSQVSSASRQQQQQAVQVPSSPPEYWETAFSAPSKASLSAFRVGQGLRNDTDVACATTTFFDETGRLRSVFEDSEAFVEGIDRMERFLSIWEEEGCRMVPLSCLDHDAYAANSQFVTHLVGRVLGRQGLAPTPIDTSGFQSVLKLVGSTTADSFDLFYGLYKYNEHSLRTIHQLHSSMYDVVQELQARELEETHKQRLKSISQRKQQQQQQEQIAMEVEQVPSSSTLPPLVEAHGNNNNVTSEVAQSEGGRMHF